LRARRARFNNMYYTYVLKNLIDNKLYVGFAKDLKNRVKDHNNGRVKATRDRKPFKLIYYEACLKKSKALKREAYFKTGFGRRFLKQRV